MRFHSDKQRRFVMAKLNNLNRTDFQLPRTIPDRIAIFSDIHGNSLALRHAIRDARRKGIPLKDIYSTGDLVGYNKDPNGVIDLIKRYGIKSVKGNHDYTSATKDEKRLAEYNPRAAAGDKWTFDKLTPQNKEFLKKLPEKIEIGDKALIVHGSPSAPLDEYLFSSDPLHIQKELIKIDKDILVTGHTHQFGTYRDIGVSNKLFVNAGSVGEPRIGTPKYTIIDLKNKEARAIELPTFKNQGIPQKELTKYGAGKGTFDFGGLFGEQLANLDEDWELGKDNVWRQKKTREEKMFEEEFSGKEGGGTLWQDE